MEKKIKSIHILYMATLVFILCPIFAGAITQPTNFEDVVMIAVDILSALLPVIIALALIYFLWGLGQYLKNDGDNKDEAKQVMLHGVIAFFVMASVWGLVELLTNTFGTEQSVNIPVTMPAENDWL